MGLASRHDDDDDDLDIRDRQPATSRATDQRPRV
jgi:hypothetical protein